MTALSELVDFKGGGTPSKAVDEYWGGDIPWASVKDFKSSEINETVDYITDKGLRNSASNLIPKGNLIIPTRMALGKVAINNVDVAINQDLRALIVKDESIVNKRYLFRFMESKARYLESEGKGATVKGITLDVLKPLDVFLPPLNEQKRIAVILDKADSLRRKRQQAIQLADQFLRSVFLDMFGDPVTNPKGWSVEKWADILKITNGKNQRMVESEDGLYPIYGSGGEMGRAHDYLCSENSIVIGRKGNINKPILVKEKYWNVDTAFGLEVKSELMLYQYFFWFCKFFNFERLNKAVTIPSLTKVDLLEIKTPVAPMNLQIKFASIFDSATSLLKKHQEGLEQSDCYFNALSQKAFAGQL